MTRGPTWVDRVREVVTPSRLERARQDFDRAESGVIRAVAHEDQAWVVLRGAMRDAARAAELRLIARRELEEAEAEEAARAARGTT